MSDDETPAQQVPEFMREAVSKMTDEQKFNLSAMYPECHTYSALYAKNDMQTDERKVLYQAAGHLRMTQLEVEEGAAKLSPIFKNGVEEPRFPRVIMDLDEWKAEVETFYPASPLEIAKRSSTKNPKADPKSRTANPDVPPRAAYLYELIKQLLLIAKAPKAVMRDYETLFSGPRNKAHISVPRAKAQRVLLENPQLSETKAAKEAGNYHQTQMARDIDEGLIKDYRALRRARSSGDSQ